jgi:hypothetical protein
MDQAALSLLLLAGLILLLAGLLGGGFEIQKIAVPRVGTIARLGCGFFGVALVALWSLLALHVPLPWAATTPPERVAAASPTATVPGADTRAQVAPCTKEPSDVRMNAVWSGTDPQSTSIKSQLVCPTGAEEVFAGTAEAFEHGFMFWERVTRNIWALYSNPSDPSAADGRWEVFADKYVEGQPQVSNPSISTPVPPLRQPLNGFGVVWNTTPRVLQNLQYAKAPEVAFTGLIQHFQGGHMLLIDPPAVTLPSSIEIWILYGSARDEPGTWVRIHKGG